MSQTTQNSKIIQTNSQNFQAEVLDFKGIVLVDFYADWCVSCKEMEKYTFPDPAVQAAARRLGIKLVPVPEPNRTVTA